MAPVVARHRGQHAQRERDDRGHGGGPAAAEPQDALVLRQLLVDGRERDEELGEDRREQHRADDEKGNGTWIGGHQLLAVHDGGDDGEGEPAETGGAEPSILPPQSDRVHAEADHAPQRVHRDVAPAEARDRGKDAERERVDGGQAREQVAPQPYETLRRGELLIERRERSEQAAARALLVPLRLCIEPDHGPGKADRDHRKAAAGRRLECLEEVARRRVDREHLHQRGQKIGDREELIADLPDAGGEPREHRRLSRPREGERAAAHQLSEGDPSDDQPQRTDERTQVAVAATGEQRGCDQSEDDRDGEQREALRLRAAVQAQRATDGECGTREQERGREIVEIGRSLAELERQPAAHGDGREHGREHDDLRRRRAVVFGLEDECERLREAHAGARDEQHVPPVADRDHGSGRVHDGDERRPEHGKPTLGDDRERNEHRAQQAHPGHELRAPAERRDETDGGDRSGDDERGGVPEIVVQSRGGEQDGVAAGDAGADGGKRRVRLSVAPAELEAGGEDERGGDSAQRDTTAGADPAAVHGQDEEEDDPEQGHDPARDREPLGSEQISGAQLGKREAR